MVPDSNRMDPVLKAILISISVFVFGMLATNESIRFWLLHPFAGV
jgi:hypothetical protein